MKKNAKINVRELIDKHQANCARIQEITDVCEKEERERNEAETKEYEALLRENQMLQMKLQAANTPLVEEKKQDPDKILRETLYAGKQVKVVLMRDIQTTSALEGTGIIPIQDQEMLKPLREGLIYDKVGLTIRTGLTGTLRWPKHTKATATFADEAVALADSKIDFSKLEAKPYRLGIAIPVTKEELDQSEGIVEGVIREEMPQAIADTINEVLFCTSKSYQENGEAKTRKVVGPFVAAAANAITFAGSVPTRKELLKMRATILKTGIKMTNPCWVMTEAMKAELEDVKIDAGSGRFLCENDQILGYPVFCTSVIGDTNIGFGDWAYQAAGFFGNMDFVVDPYTLARKHAVDFVLNANFATVTLREEAFVLGQAKSSE